MQHVLAIQILRAVAALMIVVLHAGQDATALGQRLGQPFALPPLPLAAGVDLFFVISGFVMVVSSRHMFGDPGQRRAFFGRRLARIAPIYWLMTGLFLVMMLLRPEALNSAAPSLGEIIRSLLFIPYVKPADGLMQPVFKLGWTLNYEMMFYLVFGLALALPARKAVLAVSLAMAGLATAGWLAAPQSAPLAFWTQPIILEFVLGLWIGLARIEGLRLSGPQAATVLAAAALWLVFAPAQIDEPAGLTRLVAWGIPSALVIAAAALHERPQAGGSALSRALTLLGDASYALYLCHPFAIRLTTLAFDRFGWMPVLGPVGYMLIATAGSIALALMLHRMFERPVTSALQGWMGLAAPARPRPAPATA